MPLALRTGLRGLESVGRLRGKPYPPDPMLVERVVGQEPLADPLELPASPDLVLVQLSEQVVKASHRVKATTPQLARFAQDQPVVTRSMCAALPGWRQTQDPRKGLLIIGGRHGMPLIARAAMRWLETRQEMWLVA